MAEISMTAKISAFARAYHARHYDVKIFDDPLAAALLSEEEYGQVAAHMTAGLPFFNPSFTGTPEEGLRWIVDNQLSPSPLGRAAFAERALQTAVRVGAAQYLILGAGYDTFAWRQPDWADALQIFELDRPETGADKRQRLAAAGLEQPGNLTFVEADFAQPGWTDALRQCPAFSDRKITFCSLLGLVYYLTRRDFEGLVDALGALLPAGSALAFDYPDGDSGGEQAGEQDRKQRQLAGGAREDMRTGYAYAELEALLAARGFLIYEHLTPEEITAQYFAAFNRAHPDHPMRALDNVNYCLAVKRE